MKAVILGAAGMIGKAAAYDLAHNPAVEKVRIADINPAALGSLKWNLNSSKVETYFIDIQKEDPAGAMKGFDCAISCAPYRFNYDLAKAAIKARCNFLDLGGNNDVVQQELSLHRQAEEQGVLIVPDCGLAPGLVSVLAKSLVEELGDPNSIQLRVGGLPQRPEPPLNYALVFSVQGLVNEYTEPCVVLRNGKKTLIASMQEREELEFPWYGKLEAFTTSGGISTLPRTYLGKVKDLDYKTIRYPGHCEAFRELQDKIQERTALEDTLLKMLPKGQEDVILLRATGRKEEQEIIYQLMDHAKDGMTAMMRMTAFPTTILASMIGTGSIDLKGAYTQEHFAPAEKIFRELAKRNIYFQRETHNPV